ncbi:LysR family transcriptional regulator [Curvivirga sp.]|uniref:LysR family transcriptional regulator n=1 Tax=Curvivirga sp. TaxID=2856848 RepID=UPI003B58FE9B
MHGSTFNRLSIFKHIVQEGSIRGAARKLEIAPPSVSEALKKLESEMGLPLFNRSTRRIELTEAGKLLYEGTSEAIDTLDDAFGNVKELTNHPKGPVKLTLPRFVFDFFVKPIYAEFCKAYPDIQLEISVSDESINILKENFDLGIRFGDRIEDGMIARKLTSTMKEAIFASPEYIKRYGKPQSLDDLKEHKLIQYRFIASNQVAPLIMEDNGQQKTFSMPTALIVNDTDAMTDASLKGLGLGRIVEPMVRRHINDGRLIPILENNWCPYPALYVYFPQNSQKAKRVRVLIDFLVDKGKAF